MRLLVLLCLAPLGATAQAINFDIAPTASCYAAERSASCVGLAANRCMDVSDGGYSTTGMSICTDHELDWWDGQLNAVYKVTKRRLAGYDAESPDYAPSQVEALKNMQRAWIPFRDAKCEYAATEWSGGSGAGPATIWCLMEETARQTIYLENRFQN